MLLLVSLRRTRLYSYYSIWRVSAFSCIACVFWECLYFKLLWFPGFSFTENCSAFLKVSFSDHYVCSLMFLMSLAESLWHFYCLTCIKLSQIGIYFTVMKIWDCDLNCNDTNYSTVTFYTLALIDRFVGISLITTDLVKWQCVKQAC